PRTGRACATMKQHRKRRSTNARANAVPAYGSKAGVEQTGREYLPGTPAGLIHLPGGRRGPSDERGRAPTSLSPGNASLAILGAVVARFWHASEQCTVIERIDIDDAPHPALVSQSHRDINATASANDLIGSLETERVSLKMLRIRSRQCHMRLGIGEGPRIVLAAKRALACTKHLVAWLPVGCQFHTNRTAVTLTLE